jgi:hypothetical protein
MLLIWVFLHGGLHRQYYFSDRAASPLQRSKRPLYLFDFCKIYTRGQFSHFVRHEGCYTGKVRRIKIDPGQDLEADG